VFLGKIICENKRGNLGMNMHQTMSTGVNFMKKLFNHSGWVHKVDTLKINNDNSRNTCMFPDKKMCACALKSVWIKFK
jgi:hypothetical protein